MKQPTLSAEDCTGLVVEVSTDEVRRLVVIECVSTGAEIELDVVNAYAVGLAFIRHAEALLPRRTK